MSTTYNYNKLDSPRTAICTLQFSQDMLYLFQTKVKYNLFLTTRKVRCSGLCPGQGTLHCLLEVLPRSLLLCIHAVYRTCSNNLWLSKGLKGGLFGWLRGEWSHSCCRWALLFRWGKNLVLASGGSTWGHRDSLLDLLRRMWWLLCWWFRFVPHGYNSQRQLLWISIRLSLWRRQLTGLTKVRQVDLLWFSGNRRWYFCHILIGSLKNNKKAAKLTKILIKQQCSLH